MPKKSKGRLSVVQSDKKLVFDSKLKSSEKSNLKDGLNLKKRRLDQAKLAEYLLMIQKRMKTLL